MVLHFRLLFTATSPDGSLELVSYYENLGGELLHADIHNATVEWALKRALDLRIRLQGEDHPDVQQWCVTVRGVVLSGVPRPHIIINTNRA